jgi:hypothetical protein
MPPAWRPNGGDMKAALRGAKKSVLDQVSGKVEAILNLVSALNVLNINFTTVDWISEQIRNDEHSGKHVHL